MYCKDRQKDAKKDKGNRERKEEEKSMCVKKDGGPREKRGVEVFITETSCQHAKKRGRQIARYPNRVQGCRQYTLQTVFPVILTGKGYMIFETKTAFSKGKRMSIVMVRDHYPTIVILPTPLFLIVHYL